MQFTKLLQGSLLCCIGMNLYIYFIAMLPGTLKQQVDEGSYDNKVKWDSSKCFYSSLVFIAHVVGFHYFVM